MLPVGLALLASLGFGGSAIFARVGMQGVKPLSATLISLVVSCILAVPIALIFAWPDIRALPPIAFFWFLCLGGLSFLGGRAQNFLAINRLGASRSTVILGTSAVFAAVFAIVITGERPHFLVALGTAGVVLGLILSAGDSVLRGWRGDRRALIGYALALGAAASYGGTNLIAKELTQTYGSPLMVSAISLVFGILLLAPVAGRDALRAVRSAGSGPGFVILTGLSGLAAGTAVVSLYYALQRSDVVIVSPIVATNPLLTVLLAQIFISQLERITREVVYGSALVVGGVIVVVVGSTL